jgi:aminoglycoside 3-N-acetyltransferase I
MSLEIKKLESHDVDDFTELVQVFAAVFAMENFTSPPKNHLQNLLNKADFLTFVAKTGDKVLGGLTVYVLDQYYSIQPLAYIYDLAILTEYQRQGIGKRLIAHLVEYCRQNGFEEAFVQADKVDDYAIEFYRSTNITNEEQVVHFYYSMNR